MTTRADRMVETVERRWVWGRWARNAQMTVEGPAQESLAAQQQTVLRMQQTRMALLTKWTSEQGMPDDADLPLPLQRDFHRWALERLADAPATPPTMPPAPQQMD
jgi:hypothetical protein